MPSHGGAGAAAFNDEIVTFWFASYRFVYGDFQGLVAFGGAERGTQIGSVILAQAHVKRARTGEPHAVTAFAEIMQTGTRKRLNEYFSLAEMC